MRGETESNKGDVVEDSGDKPEEKLQESLCKHQFISEKEERMKIISDNFTLIWLNIRGDIPRYRETDLQDSVIILYKNSSSTPCAVYFLNWSTLNSHIRHVYVLVMGTGLHFSNLFKCTVTFVK